MPAGISIRASTGEVNGAARIALALLWGLARKATECGPRIFDHAIARRRMNRIRRQPAALATAVKSAKNILIVCHGNVIRSVFAARLIGQAFGDGGPVAIFSAGLQAVPGRSAHPTAVATAAKLGIDLGRHVSAPVAADRVAKADLIFVMDMSQLLVMRERFPRAHAKTFLLTCLASETPLEIRDPFDGDEPLLQACFEHIALAVRPIARILSDAPQSGESAVAR